MWHGALAVSGIHFNLMGKGEIVYISADRRTPEILLSTDKGLMRFRGRSIPEDARTFFAKVTTWLKIYLQNPPEKTKVVFQLEYMNTSSSKCFVDMLKMLEEGHPSNTSVSVVWYYDVEDEDMEDTGEDFKNMFSFDVELRGIDDIQDNSIREE